MTVTTVITSMKAFRVAPGQNGQPIASLWKFWGEGNELYAMNRDAGSMKVSVHASGQVHLRLERRDLQLLAPPLPLAGTSWQHALEIRYLISPDRLRLAPRKLKKKEKAYLVDVSDASALILNLMVALPGAAPGADVPPQFCGARPLWTSSLADGRSALLVARVMSLNEENQEHIRRLRGADGPKVTFSGSPTTAHVELTHVFWSGTGGNIVLIVPAGSEAIRKLGLPASQESVGNKRQPEVGFACPDASVDLHAPNGAHVATLILEGQHGQVHLSKNEHITTQIGMFRLATITENLMPGQRFELPLLRLGAVPSIANLSPREWSFRISSAYDGNNLDVTIRPTSVGLSASDSDTPSGLQPGEYVILTAPPSELVLSAAPGQSVASAPLNARLLLCDLIRD